MKGLKGEYDIDLDTCTVASPDYESGGREFESLRARQ
jgi:hypothetical protein